MRIPLHSLGFSRGGTGGESWEEGGAVPIARICLLHVVRGGKEGRREGRRGGGREGGEGGRGRSGGREGGEGRKEGR